MLERMLRRVVDVRPGEAAGALLSAACFFCLLSGWFILRPLRDAMGIANDPLKLPWLYTGTLAGMLVVNPLFAWLVSRRPRRVFIPWTYHFFTLNILVFYALMLGEGIEKGGWLARAFFVWASVFNLFVLAVFWGFMADLWRVEQGKRLFGLVGVGGTLGAIAGAGATSSLAPRIGAVSLLLISAALLQGAALCVRGLTRVFRVDAGAEEREASAALARGGAFAGVREVARSPYLLMICALMLLFTVSTTFLYFEQARIVAATFKDSAARTAAFATIDFWGQTLTVVLQVFVTGRLIRLVGVGPALALLPMVMIVGFAALAASPTFTTLAALQVARRAADSAIAKPAREMLYTVLEREQKYKAKSLIDTFVYRGGDLIGALSTLGLKALGVGAIGLAMIFAPLGIVWAGIGLWLGKRQKKRAVMSEVEQRPESKME